MTWTISVSVIDESMKLTAQEYITIDPEDYLYPETSDALRDLLGTIGVVAVGKYATATGLSKATTHKDVNRVRQSKDAHSANYGADQTTADVATGDQHAKPANSRSEVGRGH